LLFAGLLVLIGLRSLVYGVPTLGLSGLDIGHRLRVLCPHAGALLGPLTTLAHLGVTLLLARTYTLLWRLGGERVHRFWGAALETIGGLLTSVLVL
jgi:hypothetical protein